MVKRGENKRKNQGQKGEKIKRKNQVKIRPKTAEKRMKKQVNFMAFFVPFPALFLLSAIDLKPEFYPCFLG